MNNLEILRIIIWFASGMIRILQRSLCSIVERRVHNQGRQTIVTRGLMSPGSEHTHQKNHFCIIFLAENNLQL